MIVLIDDERKFKEAIVPTIKETIVVLRNSKEAFNWFKNNKDLEINQLWLDHDLGTINGKPDDVMPIVKLIEESYYTGQPFKINKIIVHTMNNVGAKQIVVALENIYSTTRIPATEFLYV